MSGIFTLKHTARYDYIHKIIRELIFKINTLYLNKTSDVHNNLKIYFSMPFVDPITDIIGVVGFPVELPCDVKPAVEGDQLLLILWYKEGHASPIYT